MDSSDRENKASSSISKDASHIDCSVVVPLYNEAAVVEELYSRLTTTMCQTRLNYELIFVDDGSEDDTLRILKDIAGGDTKVVVVELRRNFGQTPLLPLASMPHGGR
jgi:glycosyltransferase involved in cell wall biosynthesis